MKKLSTDPYKGVRDFYPRDFAIRAYIFETMRSVVQKFGYEEYDASVIEPTELYLSKTSEEIVNEQTYTFTDRGDREMTLRPEMTPTVTRMVAGKKRELSFPLRWFSIPNVFRYERPQKGRLREHWQLNVDMFGVDNAGAEIEILTVAHNIMKAFGAQDSDFSIRISSRKLLQELLIDTLGSSEDQAIHITRLIDRKAKMPAEDFKTKLAELTDTEKANTILSYLESTTPSGSTESAARLTHVLETLKGLGITNVVFDPTIVRGFDYYTDIGFEVFDTDPENNRSLFGGGRYDGLTELFGVGSIPAVGFGMGDVTIRELLESRSLLPEYVSPAKLYICTTSPGYQNEAHILAQTLREQGVSVGVNLSDKKIGDQIKYADKNNIPFVLVLGEEEVALKTYTIKNLTTGEESQMSLEDISGFLTGM